MKRFATIVDERTASIAEGERRAAEAIAAWLEASLTKNIRKYGSLIRSGLWRAYLPPTKDAKEVPHG